MQIVARAHSTHEEIGTAEVIQLTTTERLKIILTRTGVFFVLAMVSVLIPGLHFILVPAFLIATIAAGLSSSRYSMNVIGGQVNCPHCKNPITLFAMPISWPLVFVCQKCASSVRLYPTSQNNT